ATTELYTLSLHDALPISSQDTAVFTGTAETLSGVPLTDATVHYKVDFYAPSQRKNISVADTTTYVQDDGKFHIRVPLMDSAFHRSEEHTSELQSRENLVC